MVCRSNVSIMDESSCSGCGLCSFVCPMRCVEMKENERGFILPAVGNNCIACGKCLADCPSINPPVSDYLDIGPVSYTHLDVYKRQVIARTVVVMFTGKGAC